MTQRPRKTHRPNGAARSASITTLPALLGQLEASLPALIAQPATFSSALVRVRRCLESSAAPTPMRRSRAPRATKKAAVIEAPMSLPLFP